MSRINRYIASSVQALLLAAGAGLTGAAHADPIITLLQAEASTILDEKQVTLGTEGTAAGAAAGPCFSSSGCLITPLGGVQLSYTSGNRNGQVAGSASASVTATGSGSASASVPSATETVPGGFALSDNSATATELGITGSFAAAAAASWDTLTFHGATSGETGTISITLSLASPTTEFTDVGTGGGCISIGGVCDPFTNEITGKGATETLTADVPLDSPALVFSALYVVADNDASIQTTTIDPHLILSLPQGVSFTSVSGNSGGSSGSVPEPDSLMLFGATALALVYVQRRRSGRAS